jgi:hypothetical protein
MKVITITCPEPMSDYKRRVARWLAWDGYQKRRHEVQGPMFNDENKVEATQEFNDLLLKNLRDYPECA